MYYSGQVIWDEDKKVPVQIQDIWSLEDYPKRHTHFIQRLDSYELALPVSVEAALELLEKGLISPAPCPPDHCWSCGNWWSNHTEKYHCKEREVTQQELLAKSLKKGSRWP